MIPIGVLSENNCEYATVSQLEGLAAKYFSIPESVILDTSIEAKRVTVFSYFATRKGLDDKLEFSINSIVTWSGNKPNTHTGKINDKFLEVVNALQDGGYLTYSGELDRVSYIEGEFDSQKVFDECSYKSFAIIYLDELYSILNYKKENSNDGYLNNAVLLLVFAYFRNAIYRRSNKLRPEELNVDGCHNLNADIVKRRSLYPEAYADKYNDISKKIGVSARTISKAVTILEQQLGLLVTDEAYRVKNEEGKYRTQHTIFANAYKREGEYLLASGESYSRPEMEQKAERLKEYNDKYIIDKRKRKSKKGEA